MCTCYVFASLPDIIMEDERRKIKLVQLWIVRGYT